MYQDVVIIIPSRIGSTRLPRKPLLYIGDKMMIEHVISNIQTDIKGHFNLYIATDSIEIARVVENMGVIAILTEKDCATGSERAYQAFKKIPNHDKIKYVINMQGDMPFVKAGILFKLIDILRNSDCDIITPVVRVSKDAVESASDVTVVTDINERAMYFSRNAIPFHATEFLYHVGIYGYRREALERFVNIPCGKYEQVEQLEQLRALEYNMKIQTCLSDDMPIAIDTAEDLKKAIQIYTKK